MRLPTTKNKILPNARSKPNTRSRRRFPSYTWGASASAAQGANQRPLTARPTITTMVIVITKNIKLITDQFYIIVYHTECLPLAFPINRGPLWATICGIVDYKFWRYLVEILGARIFCKLYFMHQLHHQYLFCFKSLHISDWKTLAKTTYWRVAAGDHPVVKQTLLFLSRPLPTACS